MNLSFTIKTFVIVLLITVTSLFLTTAIIQNVDFTTVENPDLYSLSFIPIGMLILAYLSALSIGGWGEWEQHVIISIPIGLGMLGPLIVREPKTGAALAILATILMLSGTHIATLINKNLINLDPVLVFRPINERLFLAVGIVASVVFIINSVDQELNIGDLVGKSAANQIRQFVQPSIQPSNPAYKVLEFLSNGQVSQDDFSQAFSEEFGENGLEIQNPQSNPLLEALGLDEQLDQKISEEVNKQIEPYQELLIPVLAVAVFGIVQLLSLFVRIVFNITIRPIFYLLKKIHFFKIKEETVQKKSLIF